jgi:hypothetical protein
MARDPLVDHAEKVGRQQESLLTRQLQMPSVLAVERRGGQVPRWRFPQFDLPWNYR